MLNALKAGGHLRKTFLLKQTTLQNFFSAALIQYKMLIASFLPFWGCLLAVLGRWAITTTAC